MVTQDLFHSMRKTSKRNALMVVKADIEKAYDRVSWRYLDVVINYYSFHNKFIIWIMSCSQNPSLDVLVNGSPTNLFSSSIGLR